MKQPDPFLAQVLGRPDDGHLRLIYADYFDERGDVRGEFIRIQQEMEAVSIYSDRYAELKPRREELRRKIARKWLEQLGYGLTYRPLFTQLPEGRAERWRLVEEFIGCWYRPLRRGDGCPEKELAAAERRLGFRLPAALREWYALAGKRKDVWERQDHLRHPPHLEMEKECDALLFYWENQGCEFWGIRARDVEQDDPPVYRFLEPARVSPTTTAFVIEVLVYATKFSDHIRAWGQLPEDGKAVRQIERNYTRCRIPARYWCDDPVHYYEGKDILIETGKSNWTWVTARTEAAYWGVPEAVRESLERG